MAHVTIPNISPRVAYIAATGQTQFPIPFPFFATTDIQVFVNQVPQAGGYAVSGVAVDGGFSSGTVTFSPPPTAGAEVVITRSVPISRTTDFPYPSQTLDIRALNTELDRLTAVQQDFAREASLGLRVPNDEVAPLPLPGRSERAGRILGFDAAGNPLLLSGLDRSSDTVTAPGSTVPRTLSERAGDTVNLRDFGAAGDGQADDTQALRSALAVAATFRKALFVPAGRYRLRDRITVEGAPTAFRGESLALSLLEWDADAPDKGIAIIANSDTQYALIRDVALLTKGSGGTALFYDGRGQMQGGTIFDRTSPRLTLENVRIRGSGSVFETGWNAGVVAVSASQVVARSVNIQGRIGEGGEPNYASQYGFRFYGEGHPVEFLVADCWVYYVKEAVLAEGVEGLMVRNCTFVGVEAGVVQADDLGRPHMLVTGCHINATRACIIGSKIAQAMIFDNLLYASILANQAVAGIDFVNGCRWVNVVGNQFENTSASQDFTGVIFSDVQDGTIDLNVFRTATTAIWLLPASSRIRVGAGNTYGAVTNKVLNQSAGNAPELNLSAFCLFDGTGTPTMLENRGFNSSITDVGVGQWRLSLTRPTGNPNHVVTAAANAAAFVSVDGRDAQGFHIQARNTTGTLVDANRISVQVCEDPFA